MRSVFVFIILLFAKQLAVAQFVTCTQSLRLADEFGTNKVLNGMGYDRSGNFWMGIYGEGLVQYSAAACNYYTIQNGYEIGTVTGFATMNTDTVFFINHQGFFCSLYNKKLSIIEPHLKFRSLWQIENAITLSSANGKNLYEYRADKLELCEENTNQELGFAQENTRIYHPEGNRDKLAIQFFAAHCAIHISNIMNFIVHRNKLYIAGKDGCTIIDSMGKSQKSKMYVIENGGANHVSNAGELIKGKRWNDKLYQIHIQDSLGRIDSFLVAMGDVKTAYRLKDGNYIISNENESVVTDRSCAYYHQSQKQFGLVTGIIAHYNKLLIATYGFGIWAIDNSTNELSKLTANTNVSNCLYQWQKMPNGNVAIPSESYNCYEITPELRVQKTKTSFVCFSQYYDAALDKMIYGAAEFEGLVSYPLQHPGDTQQIAKDKGLLLRNLLWIDKDLHGNYWTCRGSQGFAMVNLSADTAYTWLHDSPAKPPRAMSLYCDPAGYLWLLGDDGLFVVDITNKPTIENVKWTRVAEATALYGKGLAITTYGDYLFAATSAGVLYFNKSDYYAKKEIEFHKYLTKVNFELEPNQNALFADSNCVYVGAKEGLLRINYLMHTRSISIDKIASTLITARQDTVRNFVNLQKIKLSSDENGFAISHQTTATSAGIDDYLNNQFTYSYFLATHDIDTIYTTANLYKYEGLNNKTYQLTTGIYYRGKLIKRMENEVKIPIVFYKNVWFWVVVLGIVLLALFVFFYLNLNRKKQRLEIENLTVRNVLSQLNPHFINNTLNTIQALVRNDEGSKLVTVLTQNVSEAFANARNNVLALPLEKELATLHNYLYIEQVRIGKRFTFTLPSQDDCRLHYADLKLPMHFLQVLLENAVEHGIKNREGNCSVALTIDVQADYTIYKIADEGIGRTRAAGISKHTTGQGLRILNEAIALLNKRNKNKIVGPRFIDEPYTDAHAKPYGTEVTLRIPKNYTYE